MYFEQKFEGNQKIQDAFVFKIENAMFQYTDIRMNRSFFFKTLCAPPDTPNKSEPVNTYCLIKLKWKTKLALVIKLGFYQKYGLVDEYDVLLIIGSSLIELQTAC